jgi:hypothetical protein
LNTNHKNQKTFDFLDPLCLAALLISAYERKNTSFEGADVGEVGNDIKVSDFEIYESLFPADFQGLNLLTNHLDQYALSFVLRHQISRLALAAHTLSGLDVDRKKIEILELEFEKNYQIPIFGFSSLGVHILYRPQDCCRAFDFYDLKTCTNKRDDGKMFCSAHQCEAFYDLGLNSNSSTQAKMFAFYSDIKNMDQYSEEELEELIGKFWSKIQNRSELQDEEQIEKSLKVLKIRNRQELAVMGGSNLKKRYFKMSLSAHPDQGGENADFVMLKECYECLNKCL